MEYTPGDILKTTKISVNYLWFFSKLVGEEGPRIQGFKGSSEGTDTTDLLICEVRYLSSFGHFAVILYISKQDKLVKSRKMPFSVIPSRIVVRDDGQAGIQRYYWMPDQVRHDQYRLFSRQVNTSLIQPLLCALAP